jgi:hypothetical protein
VNIVEVADIDLSNMTDEVHKQSKDELKRLIEDKQDALISSLCGIMYNGGRAFYIAGSYRRELVTRLGTIELRVVKVRSTIDGRICSPILDALGIRGRKYALDVRMMCVDMASRLSYADASTEVENSTGLSVPKRTIHSFLAEIAPKIAQANERDVRRSRSPVIIPDGTKVHGTGSKEKNEVNVVIGYDPANGSKRLLAASVNRSWEEVGERLAASRVMKGSMVMVSDADRSMNLGLQGDLARQLDVVHAIKETLFKLWGEGMGKEERHRVSEGMKHALFTLVNSVKRHLADGDKRRLRRRIEATLKKLYGISRKLKREGYRSAATFVAKNATLMVTFAKLALEGKIVPYTSNVIERLMGEVAKRCKDRWMHWSTEGLENMLHIILARYTNPKLYREFWKAYIHPRKCSTVLTAYLTHN